MQLIIGSHPSKMTSDEHQAPAQIDKQDKETSYD